MGLALEKLRAGSNQRIDKPGAVLAGTASGLLSPALNEVVIASLRNVNVLTVKIVGIPIYELTKSGTEYAGKSIGIYMGAVCGICMALSVIAEELISKPGRK